MLDILKELREDLHYICLKQSNLSQFLQKERANLMPQQVALFRLAYAAMENYKECLVELCRHHAVDGDHIILEILKETNHADDQKETGTDPRLSDDQGGAQQGP